MFDTLETLFPELAAKTDFCALRIVREQRETLAVRRDIVQPPRRSEDRGAMLTVAANGGIAYAASPDISRGGLHQALEQALCLTRTGTTYRLLSAEQRSRDAHQGCYCSPVRQDWKQCSTADKLDLLRRECRRLKGDDRIEDWYAALHYSRSESLYINSNGSRIEQTTQSLLPELVAVAHQPGDTQTRSFGGAAYLRQGGMEILETSGFYTAAPQIAAEAVELLSAPNCPDANLDLVLAPDQMMLQVHESIGHPLELDRILGDERNYAGTSFVTPEMFGRYRYGSDLLNITFAPDHIGEIAAYAYDDEGLPAQREYLIRNGILLRPLGGSSSQSRSGLPGVANARASGWNRPPIDRMANLNLEPGESGFAQLIAAVEHGIYMQTNRSWSIDDARNKFQFGCERGRLIRHGELGPVVKNPNYRGISSSFWRNLAGVGDASTVQTLGTLYCGKGEPNQAIAVGHAVPACHFRSVDVFGGA